MGPSSTSASCVTAGMAGKRGLAEHPDPQPTPPQLQLYQFIIFATPIVFAVFLLLLFCLLYIRRRRHMNAQMNVAHPPSTSLGQAYEGLSKSFRQNLPTVTFNEKFTATHGETQCAVCLGDYQAEENLHQLPVCKHSFHVQCINQWLTTHATCPMCRASLLTKMPPSTGAENRHWEERVLTEAQNGSPHILRHDELTNGSGMESPARVNVEHVIHIERS